MKFVAKKITAKISRPPTVKSILRTPKIFKFKDIFKDRFTSTYNYWLYTHCKTTQNSVV